MRKQIVKKGGQSLPKFILPGLFAALAYFIFFANQVFAAQLGFVSVSGTLLLADGKQFIPVGINHMDVDSLWNTSSTLPSSLWIKANDFKAFKVAGFNSIRLAVKSDYFQDTKPPYKFSAAGFKWLDEKISFARQNGLRLILDMHMPTGGAAQDYHPDDQNKIFWDDPWMKGRYVEVWQEIARHYKNEPTIWAYDIMNEPATWDYPAYEKLMQNTVSAIRTEDPHHILIIQPGMQLDYGQVSLVYPEINDSQIVHSIHFYQPLAFTHKNVSWGINGQGVIPTYPYSSADPERNWNSALLKSALEQVRAQARSDKYPIVMTEFGTVFGAKDTGQATWIKDVIDSAAQFGLGWQYWYYKSPALPGNLGVTTQKGQTNVRAWNALNKGAKAYGKT